MTDFVGCEKAHAVSLTRGAGSAANHLAVTLIRKTKTDPSNRTPENIDMTAEEIAKAMATATSTAQTSAVTKILGMTDVTKAHFMALPTDEAKTAFLAKSTEDMNTEAAAAKTAAETEKTRAETLTTDANKGVAEVIKAALAPLLTKVTDLEKTISDLRAEDVFKTRAETDFAGHPRGTAHVASVLKSIAGAGDAAKATVEASLKGDIELAKFAGAGFANKLAGVEVANSGTAAMDTLKSKAAEVAKAQGITERAAFTIVSEDPANAALAAAAGTAG